MTNWLKEGETVLQRWTGLLITEIIKKKKNMVKDKWMCGCIPAADSPLCKPPSYI